MGKQIEKQRSKKKIVPFSLTAKNFQLLGIGILVIILGYVFLSKGPVDSVWSLTVAPILLVAGYCVIIPLSIIYKEKPKTAGD